jgi:hypothetical protein
MDFTHPKAITEPGAAFGQLQLDDLAVVQPYRLRAKLGSRPFLAGELVVSQNGDALSFQFGEKIWRVALAIENEGQSRQKCIGGQRFSVGLRGFGHKSWHDLLSQHGDQTRVDRLGEDEKRRATQAIDPVNGGAPQAEPFAGHAPAMPVYMALTPKVSDL